MVNNIAEKILEKIKLEQEISPFLFVGENIQLVNQKINNLAKEILDSLEIPKTNIFKLEDKGEDIKISEIKQYMQISDSQTPYKVQILLLENFSRANIQSQNSCLKKFEEPGTKNIYFLTNKSESGILETILSRVQTINLNIKQTIIENNFLYNLLEEAIKNKNPKNLLNYFFKSKLEKSDYITFLETLIEYSKKNLIFIEYLEETFDDLNMIKTNNLLPKITIDKWLLRLINNPTSFPNIREK